MFNEAFMFFWMIGVVGGLEVVSIVLLIPTGIAAICLLFFCAIEETTDPIKKIGPRLFIFVGALLFVAVFTPPKEAFYAGAAQYIGEAGELDQTLIDLKKLLDQKIAELAEEDGG